MQKVIIVVIVILSLAFGGVFLQYFWPDNKLQQAVEEAPIVKNIINNIKPTSTPFPTVNSKTLVTDYHVFQSFNNCGPAALSMALRIYDISVSQKELGDALRPYQNAGGDNDDKSTTLHEMGEKAEEYGFTYYHRPNGDMETIKRAVSAGFPVIARTLLHTNEDIGHYRVIKGFDQGSETITQDDSLQGKNLVYSFEEFNELWETFNYEFLILIPSDKNFMAEGILQENFDENKSWNLAKERANRLLSTNPNNMYARFNYSVALYHTGDYKKSVEEFEKIEFQLPFRTLWYQIEPIEAYYKLGNYDRVFEITDKILENHNRAFSELYMIRGKIYEKQGDKSAANIEYEKARFYNQNLIYTI